MALQPLLTHTWQALRDGAQTPLAGPLAGAVCGHAVLGLAMVVLWRPSPPDTLTRVPVPVTVTVISAPDAREEPRPSEPDAPEPEPGPSPSAPEAPPQLPPEAQPAAEPVATPPPAPAAASPGRTLERIGAEAAPEDANAPARTVSRGVQASLQMLARCADAGQVWQDDDPCAALGPGLSVTAVTSNDLGYYVQDDVGSAIAPQYAGMDGLELRVALGVLPHFPRNESTIGKTSLAQPITDSVSPMFGGPILPIAEKARDPGFGD